MYEIYAYGNNDSLYGIFNAIAAIMGANSYLQAIAMVAFCGFVTAAFAYAFEGSGRFGVTDDEPGKLLSSPELAVFGEGDTVRVVTADEPVRFLLAAALPLDEPVARYGPFVMNTREEIDQALRDLHEGTFVWTPGHGR